MFSIDAIMSTDLITVRPSDTLEHARALMHTNRIHHLPVVDAGVLVGIFSASDLFKLYPFHKPGAASDNIKVGQLMDPEPITVDIFADLIDVARILNSGSFHALPVVEAGNALVGIVTTTDLINHLLMQIPRTAAESHLTA